MTRERIEDIREIVVHFVKNVLLKTNYENPGKSDAEKFTRDFNEILDLAIKALKQEPKIVSIAEIKFDENKLKELVNKAVLTVAPQEPRWIPVSEKLPEKNVWVLVTFKMANGENSVDIKRINQWNGQWEDEIDMAYNENIIAWMPLPKPYEPQESEDKK